MPHQNVISYATFGLPLCDHGIISRCSTALWQLGHANREMSTICSSRLPGPAWQQRVLTQLGQCHHARSHLTNWKIPGCIARAFVVAYPVSRAMETSFLTKIYLVLQFFVLLTTSNEQFSADPLWQSISRLVIKWVLGAATNVSHDRILCSDWSTVSSVQGTALEYSVDQTLPSMQKWARSRDYFNSLILSADWNSSIICILFHLALLNWFR